MAAGSLVVIAGQNATTLKGSRKWFDKAELKVGTTRAEMSTPQIKTTAFCENGKTFKGENQTENT